MINGMIQQHESTNVQTVIHLWIQTIKYHFIWPVPVPHVFGGGWGVINRELPYSLQWNWRFYPLYIPTRSVLSHTYSDILFDFPAFNPFTFARRNPIVNPAIRLIRCLRFYVLPLYRHEQNQVLMPESISMTGHPMWPQRFFNSLTTGIWVREGGQWPRGVGVCRVSLGSPFITPPSST